MNQVESSLTRFMPTTLESLEGIKLLNRYDQKFVFHREKLNKFLNHLADTYQILEIDGQRLFGYETLYFDTDNYLLYHQHHNKKLNRYKVRCRHYQQSNQSFFEIKFKNNRSKTFKSRMPLPGQEQLNRLSPATKDFAKAQMTHTDQNLINGLKPKLTVEYNRMTFANHLREERLTIDTDLAFKEINGQKLQVKDMVIAELKSEKASLNAEICQYLKSLDIHPATFSKYCMGIAQTRSDVKRNRFKGLLLNMNKFI